MAGVEEDCDGGGGNIEQNHELDFPSTVFVKEEIDLDDEYQEQSEIDSDRLSPVELKTEEIDHGCEQESEGAIDLSEDQRADRHRKRNAQREIYSEKTYNRRSTASARNRLAAGDDSDVRAQGTETTEAQKEPASTVSKRGRIRNTRYVKPNYSTVSSSSDKEVGSPQRKRRLRCALESKANDPSGSNGSRMTDEDSTPEQAASDKKPFEETVLSSLTIIQRQNNFIINWIKKKEREEKKNKKNLLNSAPLTYVRPELSFSLPLRNVKEVLDVDHLVNIDSKECVSLEHYLASFGGKNMGSLTCRIVEQLMTPSVSAQFNSVGPGPNIGLSKKCPHLTSVIYRAVQRNFPKSTEIDIAASIKYWLKHSSEKTETPETQPVNI